ncbi:hypothetical protein [Burkholderia pyrrocinia]|uniref:hypothetical protein n=1 Tax=Burkholderia pyrrocinia TaxID=60550 RepID=UPI00158A272A|nr:hypothetical protein [Burkholderia pyrrocinia]
MKIAKVFGVAAVCSLVCLSMQPAFGWGCKIGNAGRKAAEPDRPPQSRVNLYVGEVGQWGDLVVRASQLQPNEWVQVDLKGPGFTKTLKLEPNKPEALGVCGKDVSITANGVGSASATIIVSTF